ncbi:DUF4194 domain-containing protein [Pseudobacteroides cellulosolvens]|uniref:DUF4194 domain-containing protein n=1 Tax=Pseudobacteroides cellulosolvens ATCC 35603 = DSM 2933 TaxID=398512 RepID=A0A0L6JV12_9FIRM|nr:DUF4194 domain-containing protein [Pseudobacteroides cellulosolvens]KNY29668.1 Protein of unknown function DUF4194 [Pseudobacteroides cellulosolvens ATCC 35603 = DSM 2933]
MTNLWIEEFEKLSISEQNMFRKCVNSILAKTFTISETYDEDTGMMKSNPEYRFIDRNFEIINTYLSYAGWNLLKDRNLGVIYIESEYEYNRLHLNSITTLFIYTLRLLYDEEREKLTLRSTIPVTTYDVVSRLMTFNTLKRKPSDKDLSDTFKLLSRFNIIQKLSGDWTEPDCKLIIFPSILMVLPNDSIGRIFSSLQEDLASDLQPNGDERNEIDETYEIGETYENDDVDDIDPDVIRGEENQ